MNEFRKAYNWHDWTLLGLGYLFSVLAPIYFLIAVVIRLFSNEELNGKQYFNKTWDRVIKVWGAIIVVALILYSIIFFWIWLLM